MGVRLDFILPAYGPLVWGQAWNRTLARQGHFPPIVLNNDAFSIAHYLEEMDEKYGTDFA